MTLECGAYGLACPLVCSGRFMVSSSIQQLQRLSLHKGCTVVMLYDFLGRVMETCLRGNLVQEVFFDNWHLRRC